jgi:hypothetical protein
MARPNFTPDALIEIISLCEQTLVSLEPRQEMATHRLQLDKLSQTRRQKRANPSQFVLIQGGLSTGTRRDPA